MTLTLFLLHIDTKCSLD